MLGDGAEGCVERRVDGRGLRGASRHMSGFIPCCLLRAQLWSIHGDAGSYAMAVTLQFVEVAARHCTERTLR